MKQQVSRLFLASLLMAALFASLSVPMAVADSTLEDLLPQPATQADESSESCKETLPLPEVDIPTMQEVSSCDEMDCSEDQDCIDECPSASNAVCNSFGFCEYEGSSGGNGGGSCDMDCSTTSECVNECGSSFFCLFGVCSN